MKSITKTKNIKMEYYKMKTLGRILIIAAIIGLVSLPALSFDREQPRPDREKMEKIRHKMEFLRNWKLMDELKLDEATASKLFTAMKGFDERNRKIMDESIDLVKQLKNIVEQGNGNEKEIQALIAKLRANMEAEHNLKLQRIDAVAGLLTVEQQAKYILFELSFKREMAGIAGRALNRASRSMRSGGPEEGPDPMPEIPEE
jgi:Spy/CpxP family protein refolding chaperone